MERKNTHEACVPGIVAWLLICTGMIVVMTLIGAITRLTESGLSIVQWNPVLGALPPLSEDQWQEVFALYKASPEFVHRNFWMSLEDFKLIFFWEWFHRLFGRLIGLVYALPLLWFWLRGRVPQGYGGRLLFILALGFTQGFMGWYMVASGLIDRPAVSHFRLAAHLGLALTIAGMCWWTALDLAGWNGRRRGGGGPPVSRSLLRHGWVCLYGIILTAIWGAFTAGLDAGLVYNTFPLMGEGLAPPELERFDPLWAAFFRDIAGVQFAHRVLAVTTVAVVAAFWARAAAQKAKIPAVHALAVLAFLQAGLGIATLLSVVYLPLAVLHQAGAIALSGLMLYILHGMHGGLRQGNAGGA